MPKEVACFQPVEGADGGQGSWKALADPLWLAVRGGDIMLEIPRSRKGAHPKAYVNGLEVVAVQALRTGDLVLVLTKEEAVEYVVGRRRPSLEPGEGKTCQFTGLPIAKGRGLRCPCGYLVGEETARKIGRCPECGLPFSEEHAGDDTPPEVLL